MQEIKLAQAIAEAAQLKGSFELRSGQTSDTYFDKYRFEADPALLAEIASHMAPLLPKNTEVLAGLELGGVPVATAISLATGLPQIFVRKARKPYGTKRLAEGPDFAGKHITIVEDIITTGGAVIDAVKELRRRCAGIRGGLRDPEAGRDAPKLKRPRAQCGAALSVG